ncbi:hypothetical protein QFC22_000574 [Naganishia vaughanmartiniae]|uniref:Uncharacterized protein n=1 Tax=Naganishia vaughanmartiniae TaxID=1424756 RepID=A0ACC2XSD8_9TREE|nr:hypothetical protein QFC22_000574 [Naganishia vaughanmartiniae]
MSTAAPPDYSQVVKERDEFQRDVTAAGIAVEGPPPNTSYLGTAPPSSNRPMASPAPQSVSQSPYPADKSGQRPRSTAQYAQPAPTPAMGYGAIQSGYSVPQQQQVAGAPLYYYQNAAGTSGMEEYTPLGC